MPPSALVFVAGALGRIPPRSRESFDSRHFTGTAQLNVALEASAELAYRRLVELTDTEAERRTMERIRQDEARHRDAFALLTEVLGDDDRLEPPWSIRSLTERFSAISEWFIPAGLRPAEEGKDCGVILLASTGGGGHRSKRP